MLARSTLLIALLVTAACSNVRGWSDQVLHVDLRQGCRSDHSYFVVFLARRCSTTGPGHSFVCWTELDGSGATVHSTACGYYPQVASLIGCLIPQKGRIVNELTRQDSLDTTMWTQRLVVRVSRDAYFAALAQKKRWATSSKNFNILSHNCTHFTHDVACAIGLQLPGPLAAEFPPDYMSRLMRIVCCLIDQGATDSHGDRANGCPRVVSAGHWDASATKCGSTGWESD